MSARAGAVIEPPTNETRLRAGCRQISGPDAVNKRGFAMAERAKMIYEHTTEAAKEMAVDAKAAVKIRAVEATEVAKDKAVEATEAVKDRTADLLGAVAEKSRHLGEGARSAATEQLSRGSHEVGTRVKETSKAVHSVEDTLRRHGQGRAANVASHAAEGLEGVGSRLQHVGHTSVWSRLGRSKPLWLATGSILAAVAVWSLLRLINRRDS